MTVVRKLFLNSQVYMKLCLTPKSNLSEAEAFSFINIINFSKPRCVIFPEFFVIL
jgi:hypothetical protein